MAVPAFSPFFFIVFDVEIALLWPWAVVFRQSRDAGNGSLAWFGMLFFLVPILVGFFYGWRFGYLDWVRSDEGQKEPELKAQAVVSPKVSIGVPVYNGERFWERCLDSLLAQTYRIKRDHHLIRSKFGLPSTVWGGGW
ncbi:MAG: NADH-quinone oxidoreductase subunit A [Phycisphaerae bacterium]|nr:NADH-quinone oxidoreductase subunit A [Phycisphaerales bacterium]